MAMVSANIGGGIVSFSFAFYHLGIFLGVIIVLIMAICTHLANILHLKVKDLTPRKYESMYELAYLLYGRASIFVVCINNGLTNLAIAIYSYIIIGETGRSFMTQFLVGNPSPGHEANLDNEEWWVKVACQKSTTILIIGLALIFTIFARQMSELKWLSYTLIGILTAFICLIFSLLISERAKVSETVDFEDLTRVKFDQYLMTSISVFMFGMSNQFMVFPTFNELEKRSNDRFCRVSFFSTLIYTIGFIIVGVCGLLLFGSEIKPDLLENVGKRPGIISIFIRISYCAVLLIQIPYYAFTVKEYTLVMLDEILNRSLSTHLEAKLAEFYNDKDAKNAGKLATSNKPEKQMDPENENFNSIDTD